VVAARGAGADTRPQPGGDGHQARLFSDRRPRALPAPSRSAHRAPHPAARPSRSWGGCGAADPCGHVYTVRPGYPALPRGRRGRARDRRRAQRAVGCPQGSAGRGGRPAGTAWLRLCPHPSCHRSARTAPRRRPRPPRRSDATSARSDLNRMSQPSKRSDPVTHGRRAQDEGGNHAAFARPLRVPDRVLVPEWRPRRPVQSSARRRSAAEGAHTSSPSSARTNSAWSAARS
jgi:hypothetical protein